MHTKSIINSKTPVKFFVYTALSLVMFGSGAAAAAPAQAKKGAAVTDKTYPACTNYGKNKDACTALYEAYYEEKKDCKPDSRDCNDAAQATLNTALNDLKGANTCSNAKKDFADLDKELYKSCKEGGMSGTSCSSKAKTCSQTFSGGMDDSTEMQVSAILGELAGSPLQSSSCPQLSGKDYFSSKKDMDREIADLQDKQRKANKDMAKISKELEKDKKELADKLKDAQENFRKQKEKMTEEEQKQVQELFKVAQDRLRQIDEIEKNIMLETQKMNNIFSSTQIKTAEFSTDKINLQCNLTLRKAKEEYSKSMQGQGNKNIFSNSNERKKYLLTIWNSCQEKQQNELKVLIEGAKQAEEISKNTMSFLETQKERLEDSKKFEAQQQEQQKLAQSASIAAQEQSITALQAEISTQTDVAIKAALTEGQTLANEITQHDKDILRIKQEIQQLGMAPSRSSTLSEKDASSDIERITRTQERLKQTCGEELKGVSIGTSRSVDPGTK